MQRIEGIRQIGRRQRHLLFLLAVLFVLLLSATGSSARNISFSWIANTDTPAVDGYRLYYKIGNPGASLNDYNGTNASNANPSPVVIHGQGTTSYTLQNLLDSEKYSFVLTSYRGAVESTPTKAITVSAISVLRASISANPTTGASPLTVALNANASTGNIVQYKWMFGDGKTGYGKSISHTFSSVGNYTTSLKVTDSQGTTDQVAVSIIVTNPSPNNNPPSAVISSSASAGPIPLSVDFDGSKSTDSDGTILAYNWDFGDGAAGDSGAKTSHTYSTAGSFKAKLTVTDNGGLTDSISTPVVVKDSEVNNTLPAAVITASSSKSSFPMTVSFSGGHSTDKDGRIVSYNWNFGDGSVASGVNVTHKFIQTAVYKVTLRVRDNNGALSLPATYIVKAGEAGNKLTDKMKRSLLFIINLLLGD